MDHNDTQEHAIPYSHKDLILPSQFQPPMPSNLELVYQLILEKLLSFCPRYPAKNLTNSELSALDDLQIDEHIVIKKADKGSNIVIQDRKDYLKEGHK